MDGGEPTYWLATGSEYSEDLKSVIFHLREGVLWSDGEPFTANDVAFTFNLLQKFPPRSSTAVASAPSRERRGG